MVICTGSVIPDDMVAPAYQECIMDYRLPGGGDPPPRSTMTAPRIVVDNPADIADPADRILAEMHVRRRRSRAIR